MTWTSVLLLDHVECDYVIFFIPHPIKHILEHSFNKTNFIHFVLFNIALPLSTDKHKNESKYIN